MKYFTEIRKSTLLFIVFCIFSFLVYFSLSPGDISSQPLKFKQLSIDASDRILILAPHPDDETIACSGIIQKTVEMNIPLRIVFLTNGDNNQWSFMVYRKHPVLFPKGVRKMGGIRSKEALAAVKEMGASEDKVIFLGYPDFCTLNIWCSHWGDNAPPARSMFSSVRKVPYKNALSPGAPYKGESILKDLKSILREFKPTKIFLSHPGDHNPDHRSLYLFCRVALWDLKEELKAEIFPYLVHYKGWPQPAGFYPDKILEPPVSLKDPLSWSSIDLTGEEVKRKEAALKKHKSQYQSSSKYLLSFIRLNELFSDFPVVRLIQEEPPLLLSQEIAELADEMPEELTDEEEASFVGLQSRTIDLVDNELVISISLSQSLKKRVILSTHVFGYREGYPFAEMPKICVKLDAYRYSIFNGRDKLPKDTVKVIRDKEKITIRIPLATLGDPQRVLTSTRTYSGEVPFDLLSWRIIEITKR